MRIKTVIVVLTMAVLCASGLRAQSVLNAGAQTPFKLTRTPGGNFLLAQSGTGAHDGKVSLLSLWGHRFDLLSGLPSGISLEGGPNGPTAVGDAHTTLYILMSEGDASRHGTPPQLIPNPNGPSSPIFSSVLRARFNPVPDGIRTGFQLTAANISDLTDGKEVTLQNSAGEEVQLSVLADFRDSVPDPNIRVRFSNPFAVAVVGSLTTQDLTELGFQGSLSEANFAARLNPNTALGARLEQRTKLYIADAGMNTVVEVDAGTGRWRVLTRFPPLPNPRFPAMGGPVVDAVPTGIFARADGTLLVSILSGFPFATGVAKIYSVNPATGAFTPYIEGLTTATEVLEVGGATYVLEISTNLLAQAPGRLLRFASPTAAPTVVAAPLIGPTGLAYEPTRNELIVSETFTGMIKRIALAP